MGSEWRDYYRIASRAHTLKAKLAEGGEQVGTEYRPKIAKKGEWLCQNPSNNYTWSINNQDFLALYRPCDFVFEQKKKKKKRQKKTNEKTSASNESASSPDAGPLFD